MKSLIKGISSKVSSSASKAVLATTITISSIALSTGIVPVNMKVEDK